jgi:hypothetical protein
MQKLGKAKENNISNGFLCQGATKENRHLYQFPIFFYELPGIVKALPVAGNRDIINFLNLLYRA